MKVLKATQQQYNSINGYRNGVSEIRFVKDGNDNWIVGKSVLTDPAFESIRDELNQLEEIPYVAPPVEI